MKIRRTWERLLRIIFLLAISAQAEGLFAATPEEDPKSGSVIAKQASIGADDWEIRVGIPGWLSGVSGDFGVRGVVADTDIGFTDILSSLDMMLAGSVYARYHRWEIFADGLYLKVSETADLRGLLFGNARVSIKDAFSEQFLGYRLINSDQGFLSVFAGTRWNYQSGDFRLLAARPGVAGRSASGSIDWVDPVVGASGRVQLSKPLSFWTKADIGGFGAASDLTWQVQGGFELQITRWLYSDFGWRYLKNDYEADGFTNKTELNGPYIETGFKF